MCPSATNHQQGAVRSTGLACPACLDLCPRAPPLPATAPVCTLVPEGARRWVWFLPGTQACPVGPRPSPHHVQSLCLFGSPQKRRAQSAVPDPSLPIFVPLPRPRGLLEPECLACPACRHPHFQPLPAGPCSAHRGLGHPGAAPQRGLLPLDLPALGALGSHGRSTASLPLQRPPFSHVCIKPPALGIRTSFHNYRRLCPHVVCGVLGLAGVPGLPGAGV